MPSTKPPARAASIPKAVLFDAYGTLFDVYSVALLGEQLFPGLGERLSVLWRDKQIEYTRLCSMSGGQGQHYRPFWDLTRAALRYAALRLGLTLDAAAEDQLMNQYRAPERLPREQASAAEPARARHARRHPEQRRPRHAGGGDQERGLRSLARPGAQRAPDQALQDRPGRLRAGPAGAEAAGARDPVRLQQLLGRDRRHLVRLHHAVGQPRRAAARTTRHRAHAHRQQPARRAGTSSLPTPEPCEHFDIETARTTVHRLQVDHALASLHRRPGAARHRRRRRPPSGTASTRSCTTWRRRTLRCWPNATGCRPNSTPGTRPTPARSGDTKTYRAFLRPDRLPGGRAGAGEGDDDSNVDAELALQAGPQLVVPITNARYALNAANARWGSLYDALYGTDVIAEDDGADKGSGYNPVRGAKVIDYARHVLDRCAPLKKGSHVDSTGYRVEGGELQVSLKDGSRSGLARPAQLIGYQGDAASPSSVLLQHNGLHLDIRIDRSTADRQERRRRRQRPGAGSGAVDHPRPGRFGGRGRRRRQGAGLRQLAGHPEGHADRSRWPRAARPSRAA